MVFEVWYCSFWLEGSVNLLNLNILLMLMLMTVLTSGDAVGKTDNSSKTKVLYNIVVIVNAQK